MNGELMRFDYCLREHSFFIRHYRIGCQFYQALRSRIPGRYLFVILFCLYLCDRTAQADLYSNPPKNSDIEVTLSGALARRNLAELLVLLGQCRFKEQKDCPTPLTDDSFPPTIDKVVSEVELYVAAKKLGVWPSTERTGIEPAFSAYYQSKLSKYGEKAFPAVTVELRTVRSRTPVFVSDREPWPRTPSELSPQTSFKLCKTFISQPVPDCIVRIEPPTREPIRRVEKGIRGTTQFVWKDLPGFTITLHLAVNFNEAANIADWLVNELTQRIKDRRGNSLPYEEDILTRLMIVAPNVQQANTSVTNTAMPDICSLRSRVGWPTAFSASRQEGLVPPPLFIADLSPMERSENEKYVDSQTRSMQLVRIPEQPCAKLLPESPEGLLHSIAVAAVIPELLIAEHELHFIETEEASNAGTILRNLGTTNDLRRPITIVPGKMIPDNDLLPRNNTELLFNRELYGSALNRVAGAEGALLAIAVPQKRAIHSAVWDEMVEKNYRFQFSDLRNDKQADFPVSPQHDLQKQPTMSSCAAWPLCLATTPFAIGVGPLDVDGTLLDPETYLLGAGWTWIAAPAFRIPLVYGAQHLQAEHAGELLQVAGFYEGTSFATPIIGALLQDIMDMTPSTDVSVSDAATLIAASSDLASADEEVNFKGGKKKRFIELVRFGRLNIGRALYLAKSGGLVNSVLAPTDSSSLSQEKFELGTLNTHRGILVGKSKIPSECNGNIKLMPPEIPEGQESDRWLAPAVYGNPLCLDPRYVVRISASRSQKGDLKMTTAGPLLDIVYLLNPSNQASNGGYGSTSFAMNAPMTVVMRELRVPVQGSTPVCDLTDSTPDKACFTFNSADGSKKAINFENSIYFGKISRAKQ